MNANRNSPGRLASLGNVNSQPRYADRYLALSSSGRGLHMNDANSYDPPHATPPDKVAEQFAIPQPPVRIGVGLLGAFFIAPALWGFIVMFTEQHALAELSVFPAMIGGGIAVGWASLSRLVVLRVIAWSAAGLGAGLILDSLLMGGLGVGTFITLSGIVLGIVGAVLGIRARPRIAK